MHHWVDVTGQVVSSHSHCGTLNAIMKKTSVGCGDELGLRGKFCKDLKVKMGIKKKGSCLVSIDNIETYPKVATFCISNNKSSNQQGDYELMNVIDATPISVGPPLNNGIHNENKMPAEFQLPAPIKQTHSAYFARYCNKHADGIRAIAELSIESSHPSPLMRFHRRPSGCLIEAMADGYSKVTWVEHVEVDDRFVHQLYKPIVNSSLVFWAQHWLGTLGSQCERKASVLASIPSSDLANIEISKQEGRRSMMRLATRLMRSYNQGVSSTTAHTWTILTSRINLGGNATINGLITWTVDRINAHVTERDNNDFAVVNHANLVHKTRWPLEYIGMKKRDGRIHG